MYQPPHFREDRLAVQHGLIRAHPFGLLVTAGRAGLAANPLPFWLDAAASPLGTLKAHLARANDASCREVRYCSVLMPNGKSSDNEEVKIRVAVPLIVGR
jgi:predicted FMN-binding regulatory protein PaiB